MSNQPEQDKPKGSLLWVFIGGGVVLIVVKAIAVFF